jgi:hypothetical protein
VIETKSANVALAKWTADLDEEEFTDMMTRLGILYDAYYPPKRGGDGA